MTKEELKLRTKLFALRVIKLVGKLPAGKVSDVISYQLIKAGTSVGANYRAACRARSTADFISKITVVEEEADESAYWLEIIVEAELLPEKLMRDILNEANELTAIFTATGKTSRANNPKSTIRNPK